MNAQEGSIDDNLQLKQWQLDLFSNGYNIKDLSEENKEVLESIVSSSLDLNMQAKVWYKMLTNTGYSLLLTQEITLTYTVLKLKMKDGQLPCGQILILGLHSVKIVITPQLLITTKRIKLVK